MEAESIEDLEFIEPEEAIRAYLRGAYAVIEALHESGIISAEQAEQARLERFDWAHDTFMKGEIDGS